MRHCTLLLSGHFPVLHFIHYFCLFLIGVCMYTCAHTHIHTHLLVCLASVYVCFETKSENCNPKEYVALTAMTNFIDSYSSFTCITPSYKRKLIPFWNIPSTHIFNHVNTGSSHCFLNNPAPDFWVRKDPFLSSNYFRI